MRSCSILQMPFHDGRCRAGDKRAYPGRLAAVCVSALRVGNRNEEVAILHIDHR